MPDAMRETPTTPRPDAVLFQDEAPQWQWLLKGHGEGRTAFVPDPANQPQFVDGAIVGEALMEERAPLQTSTPRRQF